MSLTVEVTAGSVQQTQPKRYIAVLTLRCLDGAIEVLKQDFDVELLEGESISSKDKLIKALMQSAIDKYKAEKQILNGAAMASTIASLKAGLVG